jgi:hypothetical protein
VIGTNADGSVACFYKRMAMVKNNADTVALIGSVQTIGTDIETEAGLDVTIAADDATNALGITVTGKAGTDMRWVAVVEAVETVY